MDLGYSVDERAYGDRIADLLRDALPPRWAGIGALSPAEADAFRVRWREFLVDNALIAPGWPAEYGGAGLSLVEQSIAAAHMIAAGVPRYPHPTDPNGMVLLGPTLLHTGTEEQKRWFLPRTISGEIRWAQGYSEAQAGSDLFNVRTKAVRDGDDWVVTGHKMWQTAGLHANWIFVLARTDPDAPRGKGLSFLLVPIEQAGVEVRGIRNMAGETEFAEVYFDGARTAASNVVGGVGDGAGVALALLGFERGTGGVAAALAARLELDRVVELARTRGAVDDQGIRRRIARCRVAVHAAHCLALKVLADGLSGRPPGPESSINKITASTYRQTVTELAVDLLGDDVLAPDGAATLAPLGPQPLGTDPLSALGWVEDFLHARPGTIYGGSIQVQRNTLGERALGLPREPRPVPPASGNR